jgi:hypothetical protein
MIEALDFPFRAATPSSTINNLGLRRIVTFGFPLPGKEAQNPPGNPADGR